MAIGKEDIYQDLLTGKAMDINEITLNGYEFMLLKRYVNNPIEEYYGKFNEKSVLIPATDRWSIEFP